MEQMETIKEEPTTNKGIIYKFYDLVNRRNKKLIIGCSYESIDYLKSALLMRYEIYKNTGKEYINHFELLNSLDNTSHLGICVVKSFDNIELYDLLKLTEKHCIYIKTKTKGIVINI